MKTNPKTLSDLPTGARLLYRAKNDWRSAVVSKLENEKITLIVCSPTGRTYRLRRTPESKVSIDGSIPILECRKQEDWRETYAVYDSRW